MKIIHVANFNLKHNGAIFYNASRKFSNGFTRLGHNVFNFSDRDVARDANIFKARKLGVRAANRKLLDVCSNFRPDLVVFGHADVIRPETLAEIRRMLKGVRMAQWSYDAIFPPDNRARLMNKVDHVDATFVTTAGEQLRPFSRPNNPVSYLPNPVDASIEAARSFEQADLPIDLLYCIHSARNPRQWDGDRFDITELAELLISKLPDLNFRFHGLLNTPTIRGTDYQDVMASSRMGLSLSARSDNYLYASDRMAHMIGNGLLTFVDRATRFTELYGEDELAFYSNSGEMIEKLRHYKDHDEERRRIAGNGWRKTHMLYNERIITQYMIERTFRLPLSQDYHWPTETY